MKKDTKIIVIDDIPVHLMIVENILLDNGYKNFETFDNPEDALERIKAGGQEAFIISDFQMPEMNGEEVLDTARKINQKVRGLIMSSEPNISPSIRQKYPVIQKGKMLVEQLQTHLATVFTE